MPSGYIGRWLHVDLSRGEVASHPLDPRDAERFVGGSGLAAGAGPRRSRGGYDAVLVTGQAASPVYLRIEDGQAALSDARDLWGLDTYELDLGEYAGWV